MLRMAFMKFTTELHGKKTRNFALRAKQFYFFLPKSEKSVISVLSSIFIIIFFPLSCMR